MRQVRTAAIVATVALAGLGASLLVARLYGIEGGDLLSLGITMLPSLAATVVAASVAQPLLARAAIVWRMVTIAVAAAVVSLMNLVIASHLMFVSGHDAQVVGILIAYSVAAGGGTALALSRSSRAGIEKLMAMTHRLAEGDLSVRIGHLDAEPELRLLASTLDDMATRLARSIERDRAVEEMRRDLFNAVSHDLRTPLSSLKAISEALEQGVIRDPEEVRDYVAEMGVAVDSLIKMVDDLFEVVQAEAGQLEERRWVRLGDVVRLAIRPCESFARDRSVVISTDLDGAKDVPCSPGLERVIQNLVANAVRHTRDGSVVVAARCDEHRLRLEVKDTGEGMPEGHLPLVFEPFWRGDAARTSPGSGLGLTLARRLVERLGGDIDVRSRPGLGASFIVTVPNLTRGSGTTGA